MPPIAVPRPTLRTLRPDAVAYVDPQFPAERLWSSYAEPVHTVERGEDVELTGELTLVGQEPFFTGQQLQGTYATYWFTGDEVAGVSLLAEGAEPVGAVGGAFYQVDGPTVALTTREGLTLLPTGARPEGRGFLRGSGTTLITVPTEVDADDLDGAAYRDGLSDMVSIDLLLDSSHRPCGYIINGDLDLTTWESRILPEERDRVSSQQLLVELQGISPEERPVVVSRKSGFLGRGKTRVLGNLGDLEFERSWQFPVVPAQEALTAAALTELLTDPTFRVGTDLGVEAAGGDPAWVTEIQHEGGNLQLVVADITLPDPPL